MIFNSNIKLLLKTKRKLTNEEVYKCILNLNRFVSDEIENWRTKNIETRPLEAEATDNLAMNFIKDFDLLKSVYSISVKENVSLNKALEIHQANIRRMKGIKKSKFYEFNQMFVEFLWSSNPEFSFYKLIRKSKRPKTITYKYNGFMRTEIAQLYKGSNIHKDYYIHSIADFTEKMRQNELPLSDLWSDKINISDQTISNILKENNLIPATRHYAKKHPLLKHKPPLGYIQFDPKLFGPTQTKFGRFIYVVDMIECRTGIPFGIISLQMPNKTLINAFALGYEYYHSIFKERGLNVKLKMVQTDHQLSFKRTEAIGTGIWNDKVIELGMNHRYSVWNEPQTNGKIERFHLTEDREFIKLINQCSSFE